MTLNPDLDVLLIGHVTKDRLVVNGQVEVGTGGAVYYGSIPLRRLGLKTAVVTRLHPADAYLLDGMKAEGVQVFAMPAAETVEMENIYPTADQERRICRAIGFAGAFQLADIPEISRRVTLVAPLAAGEVSLTLLKELARRNPVALDVQGFVRVRQGDQLVFRDWAEKSEGLATVTYLKMDQAEAEMLTGLSDPQEAIRTMAALGPREVMLTYPGGVLVYADGQIYQAPITPRIQVGRTGRGDTCFATYVGRRLSTSPAEACRFAAALTSLKMEQPGPFRGTIADVEARLQASRRL